MDGRKYLITEAASLNERRIDNVVAANAEKFNQVNVFSARSFETSNPLYSFVLETDLNRITPIEYKELI
jgi:hypothetical protein